MLASQKGHVDTVKLLLERGAQVNTVDGPYGNSALHVASWSGHTGVVRLLIDHAELEVNSKKKDGFMLASMNGHVDTVKLKVRMSTW